GAHARPGARARARGGSRHVRRRPRPRHQSEYQSQCRRQRQRPPRCDGPADRAAGARPRGGQRAWPRTRAHGQARAGRTATALAEPSGRQV
ncbi:hypothetical protein KEM52_002584, partial [Ascosphaera acerosa]